MKSTSAGQQGGGGEGGGAKKDEEDDLDLQMLLGAWHDSFMCVTWHDSFMCVAWPIRVCGVTHSCHPTWHTYIYARGMICGVTHSIQICVTCECWLVCDMTHPCVWHGSFSFVTYLHISVTWFIPVRDMSHSYVWHDSFVCVTWLIHVCVTWLIHIYVYVYVYVYIYKCIYKQISAVLCLQVLCFFFLQISISLARFMHLLSVRHLGSWVRMHAEKCVWVMSRMQRQITWCQCTNDSVTFEDTWHESCHVRTTHNTFFDHFWRTMTWVISRVYDSCYFSSSLFFLEKSRRKATSCKCMNDSRHTCIDKSR